MNIIVLLAQALENMFWGWNSAHFMLLGLVLWGFWEWGARYTKKKSASTSTRRQAYTSAQVAPTSYNADDYKTPAIIRRQSDK